jgi:hypothetical protein
MGAGSFRSSPQILTARVMLLKANFIVLMNLLTEGVVIEIASNISEYASIRIIVL